MNRKQQRNHQFRSLMELFTEAKTSWLAYSTVSGCYRTKYEPTVTYKLRRSACITLTPITH